MNKTDILVQMAYCVAFSDYGGLQALKARSNKELLAILEYERSKPKP